MSQMFVVQQILVGHHTAFGDLAVAQVGYSMPSVCIYTMIEAPN